MSEDPEMLQFVVGCLSLAITVMSPAKCTCKFMAQKESGCEHRTTGSKYVLQLICISTTVFCCDAVMIWAIFTKNRISLWFISKSFLLYTFSF